MPSKFKNTGVIRLLKKSGLNVDDTSNFRLISNISLTSKILGHLIWSCLDFHLNRIGTIPAVQSAYRRNHSTETALAKVSSDIIMAADRGDVSLLALLDQCGVRHGQSWHPTSACTYKSPHQWPGARLVQELS